MVAIVLGAYLAIVLYQGNIGALADAAKQDFLGDGTHTPFWRWTAAVLILMALANNPRVSFLFGPVLGFAIVAMLIYSAEKNPGQLANLNAGVRAFFGQTGAAANPLPAAGPAVPAPGTQLSSLNPLSSLA